MKKVSLSLLREILILMITLITIQLEAQKNELTEEDRNTLIEQIASIEEKDQRYRNYISIGTLNDSLIQVIEEKSKDMEIGEYMVYRSSLKLELPKAVKDSLWKLQHQLDEENYHDFVRIVKKYGYPSKERLGTEDVNIVVILFHPPAHLNIPEYLENMTSLLLPEVKAGRMEPKLFALFYDNIKAKILKEPQLYGTNKPFNMKTMQPGLPPIRDIEETNAARKVIGLPVLKEGDYEIAK
ncbi:MAG: hypothetical protein AAFP82_23045 [Bacteroidota bacterium]